MDVDGMIDRTVAKEGNYSNHPADRGGPTMWGITEQTARAYGYNGAMRSMPRSEAIRIYRRIYWERPGFDKIADIYPKVAEELFDTGVNMGPKVAATFLQELLNGLNRGASDYPDIIADGDLGPATRYSLQQYKAKRGVPGERVLLLGLDALQGTRYINLASRDPKQEAFLYGWLSNRLGL